MQEIIALARDLRDALARAGQADAARRINDVLIAGWTTGSEALVELLNALDDTREAWERTLIPEDASLGDKLVDISRELLNLE
jgi:hypothetical protein